MIITISGNIGSGKSTLAKGIAEKLGMKHYSTGELMRRIAKERGVSLLEISSRAENDESIDREIDAQAAKLGKEEDNFVIDSRLAWHFIPHSIKIFVKLDRKEAARRVFNHMRQDEKENTDVESTLRNIEKREASEVKRYRKLYSFDYLDTKNYDIVIDSTVSSEKETLENALKEIEKFGRKAK
jgi:cytidylate kinase